MGVYIKQNKKPLDRDIMDFFIRNNMDIFVDDTNLDLIEKHIIISLINLSMLDDLGENLMYSNDLVWSQLNKFITICLVKENNKILIEELKNLNKIQDLPGIFAMEEGKLKSLLKTGYTLNRLPQLLIKYEDSLIKLENFKSNDNEEIHEIINQEHRINFRNIFSRDLKEEFDKICD